MIHLLILLSIVLLVVGFVLIVISSIRHVLSKEDTRAEAGAVVIIGPVPIVIGSSRRITYMLVVLAVVLLVVSIVWFYIITRLWRVA